ncbi:MAG TPA: hypothetical protein VEF34_20185, partial [Syntrophobacteraceae bacterium]|nr:hypothetical protein [Syntrophobacteraceae bacterium]
KVPCATEEQMKNLRSPQPPPPQCQPTITGFAPQPINAIISRAHSILGWTGQKISFTAPIVWGEVATQLSNPEASTENDVLAVTVNGKPVTIKTPNAFSIQTNTNNFPCLTCYDGYPFSAIPGCENSASKPGDTGWVQFVYSQSGSGTSANTFLCIWNIDVTIGKSNWGPNCHQTNPPPGYNRLCLTPPVSDNHTLKPLAGPGSTDEIAEVIGTVSCLPAAGCTLGLLAYLPWVEGDSGWWTVQTDDLVGLGQAGNWYSVGGTMLGEGSSSEAVFSDTTLHTYVVAYSCDTSGEQTRQGLLPQPCLPINGEDLFMVGVQNVQCVTGESNNLTCNGPALNFDCSYYGCSMDYISSIK